MLFGWYIYASPGSKSFNLLVGFGNTFSDRLADQFLANPGGTSASIRYLTENFVSITLEVIKLYNVLVGGIIVIGLGVTLLDSTATSNPFSSAPSTSPMPRCSSVCSPSCSACRAV